MKMSKNIILTLILSILFIMPILGDSDVDYAVFRGKEDTSIVEVYYSIPRDMFKFKKLEDKGYFQSKIVVQTVFYQNDSITTGKRWAMIDNLSDTSRDIRGQLIPETNTFQMSAGKYELEVTIKDQNTGEKLTAKDSIEVQAYPKGNLMTSDICLASHIQKTEDQNKFSKYFGYDLIPSANLIFGESNSVIYPFYEIYNLKTADNKEYSVKYLIKDADGESVKETEWLKKNKPGKTAVEVYLPGIKVDELPSGSYNFVSKVRDQSNNDTAIVNKRIFVINRGSRQYTAMEVDRFQNMPEAKLDSIFGPLKYIATRTEKKTYKNLNTEGKRKFLSHFWEGRDSKPETEINEDRRRYEQLILLANNRFSDSDRPGWKTDRGRILLEYGRPDEIDRHQSSIDKRPYMTWRYHNVEGGVKFVFVDIQGFGRYELVHSTARNELHDESWERYINMSSSSSGYGF